MSSFLAATEAPTGPPVVADGVVVTFGRGARRVVALDGFIAHFGPGITGLVGPNGAGKSTLLRLICGLLTADQGRLTIDGCHPSTFLAAGGTAFLPENPPLPDFLTVGEFLAGFADGNLHGWAGREALPGLGLAELMSKRIGALSLGQRKRVALGGALSGGPRLILLDEPTNGLDPAAVRTLREILLTLGRLALTVIVSSHHLDELQRIAGSLVFVNAGRALSAWTRDQALARFGGFDALYEHVFLGEGV